MHEKCINKVSRMSRPVLPIAPVGRPAQAVSGWPVLRLGFRPFYLGAAALAIVSVPMWVALYLGQLQVGLPVSPMLWHAHEMLFGFAVAVIIGFLMTAARHGRGCRLLAVPHWGAGLAVAGRTAGCLRLVACVVCPAGSGVAADRGHRVPASVDSRREPSQFAHRGILVLLSFSNLAFHLSAAGWLSVSPLQVLHMALALIVLIECVIAGRVVPVFTANAIPGLSIKARPRLEQVTMAITAAALLTWWQTLRHGSVACC